MPHRDGVRIQNIDLFRDFAVAIEKSQALDHLRVYDFKTGAWTAIPVSGAGLCRARPAARRITNRAAYRYNYQSLVTPSSVFDYDVRTGQSTLLKQQEVLGGYDPDAVRQRAAVGHRARRRQGADLDRLQEGLRARRQRRRCSSTATAPTASARRRLSPATA